MFYPVRILTPEGHLKRMIPSKQLSERSWKEILKKPPLQTFGTQAEKRDAQILAYWRKLNSVLDEFSGVN